MQLLSCSASLRFETLLWVMRRKQAFSYLLRDVKFDSGMKEMSEHELELLSSVANQDSHDGLRFWATCHVVQDLSEWGAKTSMWFHGCQCFHHQTKKEQEACRLKGRRGVQLALGAWRTFVQDLKDMGLSPGSLLALHKLEAGGDQQYASFLLEGFQNCRAMMELRCVQAWSFWDVLPFTILRMCSHFVSANNDQSESRKHCLDLMKEYDRTESKASLGVIAYHFFGVEKNRKPLRKWAVHGQKLPRELEMLLLGYSTCLTVMQRLEARHHLANVALSSGRALSPAALMAGLRRRLNHDLTHPTFRPALADLLNQFDRLVPQKWNSRKELLQIVYGYGLDDLHPDISFEEQQLARQAALSQSLQLALPTTTTTQ